MQQYIKDVHTHLQNEICTKAYKLIPIAQTRKYAKVSAAIISMDVNLPLSQKGYIANEYHK